MKINSSLKNTKADRTLKLDNLKNASGRVVHYNGSTYLIRIASVSTLLLADAEQLLPSYEQGPRQQINLFGKSTVAYDLKKLCENRLYS